MKIKRILCLFDYECKTGFATVSHQIKKHVKIHGETDFQLDICAINYHGEPYSEKDGTQIISAAKSAPKHDDFGRYGFLKLLKEYDYDGIFILQDLAVIAPVMKIIKDIKEEKKKSGKKLFKSIFYFPVDCPIRESLVKDIDVFDKLVTYTEYGRNLFKQVRPDLKVSVVNHGVDTNVFRPVSKEQAELWRKSFFGSNVCEKFIVANVNRNQLRKDIPETIFAFNEFRKMGKVPVDALLYLHMNPIDPMGWDLREIAKQEGLVEGVDIMFPDEEIFSSEEFTANYVNMIYNSCDLFLTTTLGEGWGLTLHEAAACKVPIVAPLTTSFIEMTTNGNSIYGYDATDKVALKTDNVVRYKGCTFDIADAIHVAYRNIKEQSDLYKMKLEFAYKWACSKNWQDIGKQWHDLFKETY